MGHAEARDTLCFGGPRVSRDLTNRKEAMTVGSNVHKQTGCWWRLGAELTASARLSVPDELDIRIADIEVSHDPSPLPPSSPLSRASSLNSLLIPLRFDSKLSLSPSLPPSLSISLSLSLSLSLFLFSFTP